VADLIGSLTPFTEFSEKTVLREVIAPLIAETQHRKIIFFQNESSVPNMPWDFYPVASSVDMSLGIVVMDLGHQT